jgi:Ca-activated chloride channel family protein
MPRPALLVLIAVSVTTAVASDGPRLLTETTTPRKPRVAIPDTRASIRVNVNMTLVPVTVMDSLGHNVTGLGRENFRVIDGAGPRPIVTFGQQDAPISVGLVFDCSKSMTNKFKTAREAPNALFAQLNPEDESFLVTVSAHSELRQDFTSHFDDIRNALLFTHPDGTTSLIDGVYLGLSHLKDSRKPRKALIIVSDGGDNDSRYTLNELVSMATEADVEIFAICLFDDPKTQEEFDGPNLMGRLTQETGGFTFVTADVNDLRSLMAKIGVTLHNQYVLGYYPPDDAPSGKYRKIKVQVLLPAGVPKIQVYAREGYFVPQR